MRDQIIMKTVAILEEIIEAMPDSREKSLAITKFQEGIMWLGHAAIDIPNDGQPTLFDEESE